MKKCEHLFNTYDYDRRCIHCNKTPLEIMNSLNPNAEGVSANPLLDDAAHSIKTDKEIMDNYCAECFAFASCYYSSARPHIHSQAICRKKSIIVQGYFMRVRWNEFLVALYKSLPEWVKRAVRRFI